MQATRKKVLSPFGNYGTVITTKEQEMEAKKFLGYLKHECPGISDSIIALTLKTKIIEQEIKKLKEER